MHNLKAQVDAALTRAEEIQETVTDPTERKCLESTVVYLRRAAAVMSRIMAVKAETEVEVDKYGAEVKYVESDQPIAAEAATDIDVEE